MAKDDFFVIVYAILKYLYDCLKQDRRVDFDVIRAESFSVPFNYWCYILINMQERHLINGLLIKVTKDGTLIQNSGNVQITPDGIEYLFENTLIQKAKKTLKDIKDVIPFA